MKTNYCKILAIIFLSLFVVFFPLKISANDDEGPGRIRGCGTDGKVEALNSPNPLDGSKDMSFDLSNPICATIAAVDYAAVKAAIANMNNICGVKTPVRVLPSPILDARDVAIATFNGIRDKNAACAAAIAGATAVITGVIYGELYSIWKIADQVSDNVGVCGAEWSKPNAAHYKNDSMEVYSTLQAHVKVKIASNPNLGFEDQEYREYYYQGIEVEDDPRGIWDDAANDFANASQTLANSMNSGSDYTYASNSIGDDICRDPYSKNTQTIVDYNDYDPQKYYMRGLAAGNFNCRRYDIRSGQNDPLTGAAITSTRIEHFKRAYDCCINRSQNYICLSYKIGNKTYNRFCKAGSKCYIGPVVFQSNFKDNNRYICAKTYSLCPYNFTVGLGSETCDRYLDGIKNGDNITLITPAQVAAGKCATNSEIRNSDCSYNDKAGKCRNYCQYLTHCTVVGPPMLIPDNPVSSPYFSAACLNFVGDSQNQTTYNGGMLFGSQRHFSAPIAQCIKETLENLFYNRAGHSICANPNEKASSLGVCASGNYSTELVGVVGEINNFHYQKGQPVMAKSFFVQIQDKMRLIVKLVLTLSVMFYGMNILAGKANIGEKKELLMYIIKIGLVLYFATADAWQSQFFNGVYNASSYFSGLVFKIQASDSPIKQDGCQFGMLSKADGTKVSSGRTYPAGKEYLAMWDTLDCKLARYLGFGPEASVANVAKLILAGFITKSIGVYFSIALMLFGFFFFALILRALHVFLSSIIVIIIMVFVSPIIIPTVLFAKTSHIFKNWLTNLISFCFQPMILFAYIAIVINVIDTAFIGSATFGGVGPNKMIFCDKVCKDPITEEITSYQNNACPVGKVEVDPLNDSVACLIGFDNMTTFPGLEMFGVLIKVISALLSSHVKERILTLVKGVLVMYLLYKIMDEIPGMASALIGGAKLPTSDASVKGMFDRVKNLARGIQKRGRRGMEKAGKKGYSAAKDAMEKNWKSSGGTAASAGARSTGGVQVGSGSGGGGGAEVSGGAGGSGAEVSSGSGGSGGASVSSGTNGGAGPSTS